MVKLESLHLIQEAIRSKKGVAINWRGLTIHFGLPPNCPQDPWPMTLEGMKFEEIVTISVLSGCCCSHLMLILNILWQFPSHSHNLSFPSPPSTASEKEGKGRWDEQGRRKPPPTLTSPHLLHLTWLCISCDFPDSSGTCYTHPHSLSNLCSQHLTPPQMSSLAHSHKPSLTSAASFPTCLPGSMQHFFHSPLFPCCLFFSGLTSLYMLVIWSAAVPALFQGYFHIPLCIVTARKEKKN